MTGIVGSRGFSSVSGVFNGIIGIKGAIGVFKSNAVTNSGHQLRLVALLPRIQILAYAWRNPRLQSLEV